MQQESSESIPVMEKISQRLDLLSNVCDLPLIWKVGINVHVTLRLPEIHHRHSNPFCERVKQCGRSSERQCIYNDEFIVGSIAQEKKEGFVNTCHANCSELIIPIYHGDSYIATLFAGPFRQQENTRCTYPELQELFDALPIPQQEKLDGLQRIVQHFFTDLLPHLNPNLTAHLIHPIKSYAEHPQIQTAMDYARRHFRTEIKIGTVAAKCNMSISHFQHYFKRHVSYSYREYLQRVRLLEAERLLLYTNLPLGEIAVSCRLTDQSRMTMLFRRYYQTTPGVLRKEFNHGSMQKFEV